jgi:hypothetical protein
MCLPSIAWRTDTTHRYGMHAVSAWRQERVACMDASRDFLHASSFLACYARDVYDQVPLVSSNALRGAQLCNCSLTLHPSSLPHPHTLVHAPQTMLLVSRAQHSTAQCHCTPVLTHALHHHQSSLSCPPPPCPPWRQPPTGHAECVP